TDQITNTWTGTGIGYLSQSTSNTYGFLERAYKRTFGGVFYPFADAMVINGQSTDDNLVVINSLRTPGNSLSHTANGSSLSVNHSDGYNTTSSPLISYGIVSNNTS